MPKAATKKTGKVEKRRSKKDPNAPKRGLSAYMFFANEQRENVRDENPGISFGQVGKLLGERWKALNDKQRTPYEAKAAADKKRYEDEKAAYNVSPATAALRHHAAANTCSRKLRVLLFYYLWSGRSGSGRRGGK